MKPGILAEKAIKRLVSQSAIMRARCGSETSKPRLDPGDLDLLVLRGLHPYFQTPGVDPPDPYATLEAHPATQQSRASNWP